MYFEDELKLAYKVAYEKAVQNYARYEASSRLAHIETDLFREVIRTFAYQAVNFGRNLDKDPFEIATDLEKATQKECEKSIKKVEEIMAFIEDGTLLKDEIFTRVFR